MDRQRRARFLRGAFATGLANNLASTLAVLVFLPLVVSRIGMNRYGAWAVVSVFVGIASLADLGLSKTVVFLLPKSEDDCERRRIVGAASTLFALIAVVIGGVGIAIVACRVDLWGGGKAFTPAVGRVLTGYGLVVAEAVVLSAFLRAILEACLKIHLVNVGFLVQTLSQYAALLVAAELDGDLESLLAASAAVYAGILLLHLWWVIRAIPPAWLIPKALGVRDVARAAASFLGVGVANAAIEPAALFVLAHLASSQASFGEYDIAMRIARVANGLLVVFATPLFGLFSGMVAEGTAEVSRLVRCAALRSAVLLAAGWMALLIVGRPLIALWLRAPADTVYELALVLVAGVGVVGVCEPHCRALWALGRASWTFWIRVGQIGLAAIGIAALGTLQPAYRIAVAVAASSAAYGVACAVAFGALASRRRPSAGSWVAGGPRG